MNLTVGQNQCGSLRHNALLEEADSVFLQPASKQAGHDGHPEPDHQRNHAGIIDEVQQQAPLKRRQQHAGHRRHGLVLGKITSRVIRNCFQRRGWRTFTVGG